MDGSAIRGSISLAVTPFLDNGVIDWNSFDHLMDFHASAGSDAFFAVCGTSEMSLLTLDERLQVARRAVLRRGTMPVLACGNVSTDEREHPDEVRAMVDTGVDGLVLVPPVTPKDESAWLRYVESLIQSVDVPILLYEWPERNAYHISPALYLKMVETLNVYGLKDTSGHLSVISERRGAGAVFQAVASLVVPAFELGILGTTLIGSAVRPDLSKRLWESLVTRDVSVDPLAREIVLLHAVLDPSHPAGAKWLLKQAGWITEDTTRKPAVLDEAQRAALATWAGAAAPFPMPVAT